MMSTTSVSEFAITSDYDVTPTEPVLVHPHQPQLPAHWAYILHLGWSISVYGTPCIIVFGIFGNVSAFLIMSRPALNKGSTSIYFRTLAIVDVLVLVNHIVFNWVNENFSEPYHFWKRSDILCKARYAIFGWTISSSGMILTAVTFERFLVTVFPLKSKKYCTRRNAKIVCAAINIILGFIWCGALFSMNTHLGVCDVQEVLAFMQKYGGWLFASIYTYITTPTLFVLNAFLVYKLIEARRTRLRMTKISETSPDLSNQAQYNRLTVMAVTVSIAYCLLTVPTTTMNIIGKFADKSVMTSYVVWVKFGHDISLMLRSSNHSINFLLYLMTSQRIRAEFIAMVSEPFRKMCGRPTSKIQNTKSMNTSSVSVTSNPKKY